MTTPGCPSCRHVRRTRLVVGVILLAALVAVALLLPVPDPVQIRSWVRSAGSAAPLAFLLGHAVVTVAPVPRTVFTLAAGLLFGPFTGVALSWGATVLSAVLAFGLVRSVGQETVAPFLGRGALHRVNARLNTRGWSTIAALRMIPPVPFSALNYCSAVSSISLRHFLAGTALGIVPGSVAVVLLGDALTGATSPALLMVSVLSAVVGVAGLVLDLRVPSRSGGHPSLS
jgi:uncharacterized membrane protein YdjX (TVP38/TMEM64 family)